MISKNVLSHKKLIIFLKIMDYSLLIGIHNVDQAMRERDCDDVSNHLGVSDAENSSTGKIKYIPN